MPRSRTATPAASVAEPLAKFKVEVEVQGIRVVVPCGDGSASVGWLVQQAQSRYDGTRQGQEQMHVSAFRPCVYMAIIDRPGQRHLLSGTGLVEISKKRDQTNIYSSQQPAYGQVNYIVVHNSRLDGCKPIHLKECRQIQTLCH